MQMDCKKTAPVGVFDSGVGGLTVAREISRQLPNENIVYFGDTARVPYIHCFFGCFIQLPRFQDLSRLYAF